MSEKISTVYIKKVKDYNDPYLLNAVAELLDASGLSWNKKTVLLKPNMLSPANNNLAVTTHPAVLEAAVLHLQKSAKKVFFGDSPGIPLSPYFVMKKLGYQNILKKTKALFTDFDKDKQIVNNKNNRLVKSFTLARIVVETDILINLPKMKTHVGAIYSGAVKNLFGCIPGLIKAKFHFRFPTRKHFGILLADCASTVEADFHIMDAIIAMEGEGPSNGKPVNQSLILASKDPVALDAVCCSIMGLNPKTVPHLVEAEKSGLGTLELNKIKIEGVKNLEDVTVKVYENRSSKKEMRFGPAGIAQKVLKNLLLAKPVILEERCKKCQLCVKICPITAISSVDNGVPKIDYNKCFRCYCCHEICPEHAIIKKDTLLSKIIG